MKILVTAIAAVLVVGGLSVVGLVFFQHTDPDKTGARSSAGPVLDLGSDTFDLGDVPADQTVERVVSFANPGSAPLDVAVVKVRPAPDAACGCGVEGYEVRPGTIPAGGAGELVFKLRVPANMPDMEDVMIAELSTNDPANLNPKIRLVFRMAAEKNARNGG